MSYELWNFRLFKPIISSFIYLTAKKQRNKVFLFCQSEFISDSVFIEMLKQVQHDNIMSGLICVNL
jgi:hypothetical protein